MAAEIFKKVSRSKVWYDKKVMVRVIIWPIKKNPVVKP